MPRHEAPWEPPPRPALAALLFLRGRDADARLRAIEAQRTRLRPVLGALAGRLRETQAWRPLAFRTLSDYARERLGVGGRVVQEWARVWQALEGLPRLRAAVLAGEVSWTVARRVVRVATPETDAACVETVRARTVRAVDALLAAVRRAEREHAEAGPEGSGSASVGAAEDVTTPAGAGRGSAAVGANEEEEAEEAEERVAFRMACPREVGTKWNAAIELARRSKGEQLPVWACAEVIAAEVASALPPEPEAARDRGEEGDGSGAVAAGGITAAGVPAAGVTASEASAAQPAPTGLRAAASARPAAGAGPPGPRDPEPGLRAAAFPHLPWCPVQARLPAETELELGRLVEGLEACGPHELDGRLRAAVGFAQALDGELGRVLRQVVVRGLYHELGFRTFESYVRERLDTAPRTAQRLVRLARAELRAPAVAAAFRQGEVTAFQADVLLGVVERGGPRAPRPAGMRLSQIDGLARLQELASQGEEGRGELNGGGGRSGEEAGPETTEHLEARWLAWAQRTTLRRLELEANAEPPAAVAFMAPPEAVAFFRSVMDRVQRRLVRHQRRHPTGAGTGSKLPPWAALEAMLEHVIVHWLKEEQAATRRKPRDYRDLFRDGNRCTMPGCTARAMLQRHHIWYRSDQGPDVPENRISLCWAHHRAVHRHRARITGQAPDRLLFELGTRPDGPPLARYRSGDVAV